MAIEGVARLVVSRKAARAGQTATRGEGTGQENDEPVQQRLAALMFEVHDLLHRVFPAADAAPAGCANVLRLGDLALDLDRLTVTAAGEPVTLTTREVLVLRYLRVSDPVSRRGPGLTMGTSVAPNSPLLIVPIVAGDAYPQIRRDQPAAFRFWYARITPR